MNRLFYRKKGALAPLYLNAFPVAALPQGHINKSVRGYL